MAPSTSKSGNWRKSSPREFHNLHYMALQSSVFLGRHAACICTNSFS